MPIDTNGYLTTKQLQKYIREKYNRHWGRMYIYLLKSKGRFTAEKIGHQNFYPIVEIDNYIQNLKRNCSIGK